MSDETDSKLHCGNVLLLYSKTINHEDFLSSLSMNFASVNLKWEKRRKYKLQTVLLIWGIPWRKHLLPGRKKAN